MENNEIKIFSKKVLTINLIILIVVSFALLLMQQYSWVIGYVLGSITSYITYLMHVNNVDKMCLNKKSPVKSSVASALLRFCISALCLAIGVFVEWVNIYATFIGLLVIKLTIYVLGFMTQKKVKEGK